MTWEEFSRDSPELAKVAEALFEQRGVVLVGTVRKDGSPRISPVEPLITGGQLYFGMMWQSLKALDLLRDSRCTVHSAVRDRFAADGEFKLHGGAFHIQDVEERRRYGDAVYKKKGWKIGGLTYHLFRANIMSSAVFTTVGEERIMRRWRVGEPMRKYRQYIDGRMVLVE